MCEKTVSFQRSSQRDQIVEFVKISKARFEDMKKKRITDIRGGKND